MKPFLPTLPGLLTDRRGAVAVEYGLMLALIVLAMLGALSAFGGGVNSIWGTIANKVETASSQALAG